MGSSARPLVAFLSLYRDGAKVLAEQPIAVKPPSPEKLAAVPFRFKVPLNELVPGEYECQVTVVDPAERKANFWLGTMRIAP